MSLNERRTKLVQKINGINDEQTLEMLEQTLAYYTDQNSKTRIAALKENEEIKYVIVKKKNSAFAKYLR